MIPGQLINGTISQCCQSSCSTINGHYNFQNKWIDFHYLCNKCKKETKVIIKPMWIIIDKLKYKPL